MYQKLKGLCELARKPLWARGWNPAKLAFPVTTTPRVPRELKNVRMLVGCAAVYNDHYIAYKAGSHFLHRPPCVWWLRPQFERQSNRAVSPERHNNSLFFIASKKLETKLNLLLPLLRTFAPIATAHL